MQTQSLHHTRSSWGDAAVDGLISGVAAGLLMAVFLLAAGGLGGRGWEDILRQFDPSVGPSPLTGAVTHLAVSGVYGILFASLWRPLARWWRRVPAWLVGLVYGLLLWLLAATVTAARSSASGGWLQGIPPAQLAAAHLVYGMALGWLVRRLQHH
jgi:hypothetical protein